MGLDTNPSKWGPTPFRFESKLLLHPDFKECIGKWRRELQVVGWEGYKIMQKLQGMKAKLKLWNKDNFGNIKEKKEAIIKDITMVDFYEAEDAL